MLGNEGMIRRKPILHNALRGLTPTCDGWDVDPSGDIGYLTDGSLANAMTSGSNDLDVAYEYCYIDFEIPSGVYLVGGYGKVDCAAATGYIAVFGDTKKCHFDAVGESAHFFTTEYVYIETKLRFGLSATDVSTITPNIYELWAYWIGDL